MDRFFDQTDTGFFYGFEYPDDRPRQGVYVTGIGLTYDAFGAITGGTVTEIRSATWSSVGGEINWVYKTYTDVNLTVAELSAFDPIWYDTNNFTALSGISDTIALTLDGASFQGSETADIVSGTGFAWNGNGGDDVFNGGGTVQLINGGDGDDRLSSKNGDDQIFGDAGNDTISGGNGSDTLRGGEGDDVINGGNNRDFIQGNEGNDDIRGGNGDDDINGNDGDDVIRGQSGNDKIYGDTGLYDGTGNDRLYGGSGDDELFGGAGDDRLYGGRDNDLLQGGAGDDLLNGGGGNDTLIGFEGNDRMSGGSGDDVLVSGSGNQIMNGGSGDDLLQAAVGSDTLKGGTGADVFEFTTEAYESVTDMLVTDFNVGEDKFAIVGAGFDMTAQDQFDQFLAYATQMGNNVVFDASAETYETFRITLRHVELDTLTVENFVATEGILDVTF